MTTKDEGEVCEDCGEVHDQGAIPVAEVRIKLLEAALRSIFRRRAEAGAAMIYHLAMMADGDTKILDQTVDSLVDCFKRLELQRAGGPSMNEYPRRAGDA